MNELIPLQKESLNPVAIFAPAGGADLLARIQEQARSIVIDISTPKGRENCASVAHKIAKSKVLLDDMGKELAAEAKRTVAAIDAERKFLRDGLDALKDEIRAPLTEWENRDKSRIAELETAINVMNSMALTFDGTPSADLEAVIARVEESYKERKWDEFAARAKAAYESATDTLTKKLDARRKYETEQEELLQLRREAAEREQRERDERLKAEAAEHARKQAEAAAAKAAREAEEEARMREAVAKAEVERAENARQAEQKAREDAEARAIKAEQDRKESEKRAEEARIEAAAKAERDKAAAAEKAKREAEEAAKRERERIEAERKAEADAQAAREADKAHREKINREAVAGILKAITAHHIANKEEAEKVAKTVIEVIAKGTIPHVKITY